MLILNQMGKIANLANTHGIQKLDEALMMRAIRENLDIPHRTIRRPHYKPPAILLAPQWTSFLTT